jgi:GTP-binding protein Era
MSQHCGVVAVVGAPNAGKSTLVNTLVGEKVAIVSPKVQTTRARLMGIATEGEAQLLLVDTPGIFAPRRRLDRAMVRAAWEGASGADIVLMLIDARRGMDAAAELVLGDLANRPEPKWLVLNKVDIATKERLLPLAVAAHVQTAFVETFMIAASTGDGVADLKARLAAAMPQSPWHFPADQLTDATTRLMALELTREQLYLQLHAELPYAATVETEKWEEKGGTITIHQQILVERDSQKGIVLGKGGTRLKAIGMAARAGIAALTGSKVNLFLHVKVKENWAEDRDGYGEMGLDWVE